MNESLNLSFLFFSINFPNLSQLNKCFSSYIVLILHIYIYLNFIMLKFLIHIYVGFFFLRRLYLL